MRRAGGPVAALQTELWQRREEELGGVQSTGGPAQPEDLSADLLGHLHLMDLPLLQHPKLLQDQGNTQVGPGWGSRG